MWLKELKMKLLAEWKVSPKRNLGVDSPGRAGGQLRGIQLRHSDMSNEILDGEAYRDGGIDVRMIHPT
jgi:hypothetical protein